MSPDQHCKSCSDVEPTAQPDLPSTCRLHLPHPRPLLRLPLPQRKWLPKPIARRPWVFRFTVRTLYVVIVTFFAVSQAAVAGGMPSSATGHACCGHKHLWLVCASSADVTHCVFCRFPLLRRLSFPSSTSSGAGGAAVDRFCRG